MSLPQNSSGMKSVFPFLERRIPRCHLEMDRTASVTWNRRFSYRFQHFWRAEYVVLLRAVTHSENTEHGWSEADLSEYLNSPCCWIHC